MTIKDLEYALWLNGVMPKDAGYILSICKEKGIFDELIDDELEELGYDKIFDIDNNFMENQNCDYIEKFPRKNRYIED